MFRDLAVHTLVEFNDSSATASLNQPAYQQQQQRPRSSAPLDEHQSQQLVEDFVHGFFYEVSTNKVSRQQHATLSSPNAHHDDNNVVAAAINTHTPSSGSAVAPLTATFTPPPRVSQDTVNECVDSFRHPLLAAMCLAEETSMAFSNKHGHTAAAKGSHKQEQHMSQSFERRKVHWDMLGHRAAAGTHSATAGTPLRVVSPSSATKRVRSGVGVTAPASSRRWASPKTNRTLLELNGTTNKKGDFSFMESADEQRHNNVSPSRRILYGFSPPRHNQRTPQKQNPTTEVLTPHKKLSELLNDDKEIAKKCVRAVVCGGCVPGTEFKQRIGFHQGDARRMYDSMCASDAWARSSNAPSGVAASALYTLDEEARFKQPLSGTSPVHMLIHNCMNEVLRGSCKNWARWFGSTSRRRVEEAFERITKHVESIGLMLTRQPGTGRVVQLAVPDSRRSLATPDCTFYSSKH